MSGQIFGLDATIGIPENCVPVEAVAVVKYMGEDGEMYYHLTSTSGLSAMERLGMLEASAYTSKLDMHDAFEWADEEEGEEEGDEDGS